MAPGYILIYPCSYHGNGIYLEYVPIVPFDVRCQSGIYLYLSPLQYSTLLFTTTVEHYLSEATPIAYT